MEVTFRQILRHTAVFGVGAILGRLASIVLLPVYTRYLAPSDYGVIALIDLTVNLLGITAGAGIASAATREHFQGQTDDHWDRVWWTAIAAVAVLGSGIFGTAMLFRHGLAYLAFGDEVPRGDYYFALALVTLWFGGVTYVVESYFRSEKASGFLVLVNLLRLAINIALNVVLLVWFGLGIAAVLWGNLIATAATLAVEMVVFRRRRRHVIVDLRLVRPYWRFGWPLVAVGLLSVVMHEADRYVLRWFLDLHQVGLYSIAYQIGQGVNTLVVAPFVGIWSVLIYDVARQANAAEMYSRVFKYFVFGLGLILLLASLFAQTILNVLAPPEYADAARIVPVVCLAYLLFSLHEHFKVPALLKGETVAMVSVVSTAAVANIAANVLLIPIFGVMGAAWASVATFLIFSGGGLVKYRRIARYDYPFATCALVVAGMMATYLLHRVIINLTSSPLVDNLAALVLWIGWASALFARVSREVLPAGMSLRDLVMRFAPAAGANRTRRQHRL